LSSRALQSSAPTAQALPNLPGSLPQLRQDHRERAALARSAVQLDASAQRVDRQLAEREADAMATARLIPAVGERF
jgi:hypothetical protein